MSTGFEAARGNFASRDHVNNKRGANNPKTAHRRRESDSDDFRYSPVWFRQTTPQHTYAKGHTITWNASFTVRDPLNHNNRPDIVWETPTRMYIIEVSCPLDRNAVQMRNEKIAKYNPLVHELSRIHKKPVSLVPIVIGCTGVVADGVAADLASLPVEIDLGWLQKIVALSSAAMVRRWFAC